ncbi:MAG: hypothetical protein ACRDB0_08390 [Paraclostridium sp.]
MTKNNAKSKLKVLDLESNGSYLFETLDQLVDMLKDEYEVSLHIKEKGKLKKNIIRL